MLQTTHHAKFSKGNNICISFLDLPQFLPCHTSKKLRRYRTPKKLSGMGPVCLRRPKPPGTKSWHARDFEFCYPFLILSDSSLWKSDKDHPRRHQLVLTLNHTAFIALLHTHGNLVLKERISSGILQFGYGSGASSSQKNLIIFYQEHSFLRCSNLVYYQASCFP